MTDQITTLDKVRASLIDAQIKIDALAKHTPKTFKENVFDAQVAIANAIEEADMLQDALIAFFGETPKDPEPFYNSTNDYDDHPGGI